MKIIKKRLAFFETLSYNSQGDSLWSFFQNAVEDNLILRNCVMVARQTLTLFVRVRILLPQPSRCGSVW